MTVEIRAITVDEVPAHVAQLTRVFGGGSPHPGQVEWMQRVLEVERAIGGFENGAMVASAGVATLDMTLPGGTVARCAGVTRVSVLPTHRRRGILRALMRQQLDDIHARGEAIAALYASQAAIYGRFGYGPATWHADVRLNRPRSALRLRPDEAIRTRLVPTEAAIEVATAIHSAVAAATPGAVGRGSLYWEGRFLDRPEQREGMSELNHVVVEDVEGGLEGFASYRIERHGFGDDGAVHIRDLLAATARAYNELWRFCAGIDLMARTEARQRPADEPLRMALADPRALNMRLTDGIWIRLVDVPAALIARRYSRPGRLVIRVRDEFCPSNQGTHELEVGDDGTADCRASDGAPDLELDVSDLGACYLGGTRFGALSATGLVSGNADGVERADAMFRSEKTPWCPTHF